MKAAIGSTDLKKQFARSEWYKRFRALLLVMPLFLFVVFTFLSPVFYMLYKSVDNKIVPEFIPRTVKAIEDWDVEDSKLPPNIAFAGMLADMKAGTKEKTITQVGRRLNFESPGLSSVFRKSARNIKKVDGELIGILESHYAIEANLGRDSSGLAKFLAEKIDILDDETAAKAKAALISTDEKWGEANIWQAIKNSSNESFFRSSFPHTLPAIANWDIEQSSIPPDAAFAGMLLDIKAGVSNQAIDKVGQRLGFEAADTADIFRNITRVIESVDGELMSVLESHFAVDANLDTNKPSPSGSASYFSKNVKTLNDDIANKAKVALIKIDKKWGEPEIWRNIKYFSGNFTDSYFFRSVDSMYDSSADGFQRLDEKERIYVRLFIRTLILSIIITVSTILLGYPVAFLLSNLPLRISNLLMILVLLPFWTSLLVRTSSWIVLLQSKGVVNELLVNFGIINNSERLEIIHNSTGTIIAMTHILLRGAFYGGYRFYRLSPGVFSADRARYWRRQSHARRNAKFSPILDTVAP